jgi:hypothetical protein
MRRTFAIVSAGIAAGVMLVLLAFYCLVPLHAGDLSYSDPVDYDLDPDLDAIALAGTLHGRDFEIILEVRGEVDSFRYCYQVQVIGRCASGFEGAHVYNLYFYEGWERSYGVFAYQVGNCLIFSFPLRLLLDDAYIVGLEAFLSGFSGSVYQTEFVNSGNREDMLLSYALDLGLEPLILLVAGVSVIVASVILFIAKVGVKTNRRTRRPGI